MDAYVLFEECWEMEVLFIAILNESFVSQD